MTVCRAANVTADALTAADPTLIERARRHVGNLRGLTVDQAHAYAIANGVDGWTLHVADAMAREADRLIGRRP